MPKIQKNKIEQCTKIFIYRDLKETADSLVITIFKIKNQCSRMDFCVLIRTRHHEQKKSLTVAKLLIFGVLAFVPSYVSTTH